MSLLPRRHKMQFRYGEKTNFVYNWSNDFLLNIMHFYFQLVRSGHSPLHELEIQLAEAEHAQEHMDTVYGKISNGEYVHREDLRECELLYEENLI